MFLTLLAFAQHHRVELDPGVADAADGGEQQQGANGARIGRVGRAAISGKPAIQSRNSVPLQAVEIVADGMEWRSPCSVGHALDEEVPCGAETKPRINYEVYSVQRGVVR